LYTKFGEFSQPQNNSLRPFQKLVRTVNCSTTFIVCHFLVVYWMCVAELLAIMLAYSTIRLLYNAFI